MIHKRSILHVKGFMDLNVILPDRWKAGEIVNLMAYMFREYGLPCLVGATGATKFFKTGDTVLLDTNLGRIYKL